MFGVQSLPNGDIRVSMVETWAPIAEGPDKREGKVVTKYVAEASDSGFAIALAMVQSTDLRMDVMHRELFPHRYIQIANG